MRPRTIADIAERALIEASSFDWAAREFLDAWQNMSHAEMDRALGREPVLVGTVQDAYLAALAEHLALSEKHNVPDWTNNPNRFLSEPFFAGNLESLKAILIAESPLAFRRRLIFVSADALSRPKREVA
ncbi:MAG TPA: hypothetical protein VGG10_06225 [Rhizomicrobium sp.]|jgi:hypothetical protein